MKNMRSMYYASFYSFILSAMFFMLILILALTQREMYGGIRTLSYVLAAAMWSCLLLGAIFLKITGTARAKLLKSKEDNGKFLDEVSKGIGVITFFKNKKAMTADIILLLSFAAAAAMYFLRVDSPPLIAAAIMTAIFALILHSFWNGRNYRCLKYTQSNKTVEGCSEDDQTK